MQRALQEECDRAGEKDGYVYEELAECLLALGEPAEAARYFGTAYDELSKDHSLSASEPGRLERLKNLGKVGNHKDK